MSAATRASGRAPRHLVLVGGGHTHVQVLARFAMAPPPATRVTVVLDRPVAVYSGMVPGFVAGHYRVDELEIDVVPLARRAGARVVLAPALRVDAEQRRVHVAGRPPIRYDLASVDIGSTVAGLDRPGVAEHALATRPIGRFVRNFDALLARARRHAATGSPSASFRVVVVGAGAGGVEVAFTLERRLRREGITPALTLIEAGARLLPGYGRRLAALVERRAEAAGIARIYERRVVGADADRVALDDGSELPCDALVWVAGAVAHPFWRDSGLDTDPRGFVWTRRTLQVEGFDDLFAVGDCATLRDFPRTAKAGVYAVRQGPYLIANLRAALGSGRMRLYRPQRDFLTLLNLGDGTAAGAKWGLAFAGRWVMALKDRIDRRFMDRFQVLDGAGRPNPRFTGPAMPAMAAETDGDDGSSAMLCGGCAAKLGQRSLDRVLEALAPPADDPSVVLGLGDADDAAAVRLPAGDVAVSSVDAFSAFTDDPYLVGRIAAVNALSDVYAKGASARWAQAMVALPQDAAPAEQEETLAALLAGARAALDPLGVTLLGGHTLTAPALLVGFVVEGLLAPDAHPLRLDGLRSGQSLILTKALGTGVLFHADMRARATGRWIAVALAAMARPNDRAAEIARRFGATAATDVTGFGLVGHLAGMLRASGCAARLELAALPALDGAVTLLAQGLRSTAHRQNARALRAVAVAPEARDDPALPLLFDPQTSGGLLFGVAPERAAETLAALHAAGDGDDAAAIVGETVPYVEGAARITVVASERA